MTKSDVVLLLTETWSNKYKKSIDCSHPKGFSQKAHCRARKLRKAGVKTKSKPVKESVTSFKTSKGSEYTLDNNGNTIRLKKSQGKGYGETHKPMPVVYLSKDAKDEIVYNSQGGRIILVQKVNNQYKQLRPTKGTDLRNLSDLFVVSVNRTSGQIESIVKASTKPEIGKHPFEISYEGSDKTYHIGNDIVSINESYVDNERKRIQAAIDKLEKEYDRLDSTGQDTTQITKQLKMLRGKLPVTQEKGKELFAKIKQSLT